MDVLLWPVVPAFIGVAAVVAGTTHLVIGALRRRAILDRPNERSSHTIPTPRGGGWGVVPPILLAWAVFGWTGPLPDVAVVLVPVAVVLVLVSWWDDLSDLSAGTRLMVQLGAVAVGLASLPGEALVFQGLLPLWLDRVAAGFAWLWFVNLFNFMDGIDGISGTELATIGFGLAAVALVSATATALVPFALTLAGGGLGFLIWNWHPARVFLGDVGSVPLGYLAGWLLIAAAAAGLWLPALILPLYYLADATITLLRRLVRGEKIWAAHRQHFYQQAVRTGFSHDAVVRRILAANAWLVVCALATPWLGGFALAAAAVAVTALLHCLSRAAPAGPSSPGAAAHECSSAGARAADSPSPSSR